MNRSALSFEHLKARPLAFNEVFLQWAHLFLFCAAAASSACPEGNPTSSGEVRLWEWRRMCSLQPAAKGLAGVVRVPTSTGGEPNTPGPS